MPIRRNRVFYCRSYCLLNVFRGPVNQHLANRTHNPQLRLADWPEKAARLAGFSCHSWLAGNRYSGGARFWAIFWPSADHCIHWSCSSSHSDRSNACHDPYQLEYVSSLYWWTYKSPSPYQRLRRARRSNTILHYTHSSGSMVFHPHPAQGRRLLITLLFTYAS